MNLVDCYVTEVIGKPYAQYGKWWRKVKYESEGRISEGELWFITKQEAEQVQVGHQFLA